MNAPTNTRTGATAEGGISSEVVRGLADRYGTPLYAYDLAAVRTAHADLRRALPAGARLYYSLKANPHPLVVAQLAALGCQAEVSSVGELDAALAGGFAPWQVLLTGPGKTAETIEHALLMGVRRFSVDSPADLDRVGQLAQSHRTQASCLLRVNADQRVPGMPLTMTGTASQFGADAGWIVADPQRFRGNPAARVCGLHLYMGTNLDDEHALLAQFEVAVGLAVQLSRQLGPFDEIDLGGGFGAPFARTGRRPDLSSLAGPLTELLDARLPAWRYGRPQVSFESGRYLVADCGVLASRVVDVKPSKDELFVVLDTGIHHLGGMSGLRRLPRIVPSVLPTSAGVDDMASAAVVGPLCTPLDTFSRGVALPALRIGDLVTIPNVGAYGLTASLVAFLGHRLPVEAVVDGAQPCRASRLGLVRTELPAGLSAGELSTQPAAAGRAGAAVGAPAITYSRSRL